MPPSLLPSTFSIRLKVVAMWTGVLGSPTHGDASRSSDKQARIAHTDIRCDMRHGGRVGLQEWALFVKHLAR